MKRAGLKNFTEKDMQRLRELEGHQPVTPEKQEQAEWYLDHLAGILFWGAVIILLLIIERLT